MSQPSFTVAADWSTYQYRGFTIKRSVAMQSRRWYVQRYDGALPLPESACPQASTLTYIRELIDCMLANASAQKAR